MIHNAHLFVMYVQELGRLRMAMQVCLLCMMLCTKPLIWTIQELPCTNLILGFCASSSETVQLNFHFSYANFHFLCLYLMFVWNLMLISDVVWSPCCALFVWTILSMLVQKKATQILTQGNPRIVWVKHLWKDREKTQHQTRGQYSHGRWLLEALR